MKIKIVITIFSLLFFLLISELYFAAYVYKEQKRLDERDPKEIKFAYHKPFISDLNSIFWDNTKFRYYDKNSDKTIMILGCSYAYGEGLKNKENLSALLSEALKYNVINAGFGGHGIQSAYKFLKDFWLEKEKKNNVDIFIYVYMKDHLRRIYKRNNWFSGEIYPHFEYRDSHLVEIKPIFPYIYASFLFFNLNNRIIHKKLYEELKTYKDFNIIISELQNTIKKINPNSKTIILVVPVKYTHEFIADNSMFPSNELTFLEELGIKVINAEELTNENLRDEKWYIEDKSHPSSQYRQLIVPKLSEIIKSMK